MQKRRQKWQLMWYIRLNIENICMSVSLLMWYRRPTIENICIYEIERVFVWKDNWCNTDGWKSILCAYCKFSWTHKNTFGVNMNILFWVLLFGLKETCPFEKRTTLLPTASRSRVNPSSSVPISGAFSSSLPLLVNIHPLHLGGLHYWRLVH